MREFIHKSLIYQVISLFLVFFCGSAVGFERWREPIVLQGDNLSEFIGDSLKHFFVYAYNNGWQQIPFQIDEKSAAGSYFQPDDGLLDGNDELCFMVGDGGDTTTNWLPGTADKRYKIKITNPLNGEKTFVYLYYSTQLPHDTMDYVHFSGTSTNCITAWGYITDFVDGNPAINEVLKITPQNGGSNVDLIDRNKMRTYVDMPWPLPDTLLTENDQAPNIQWDGFVDGRVRVITSVWSKDFFGYRVATTINYYYKSMIITTAISHGSNIPMRISWIRISADYNHNLTGLVYYDASGNGPLYIDGVPDTYDSLPIGMWMEIDHPSAGCIIGISDTHNIPETARLFYQDGGADPSGIETGEDGIWGESGMYARNVSTGDTSTVETWTFLLPANQGNVGAKYNEYYNHPLIVACSLEYYAGVEESGDWSTPNYRLEIHPNPFHTKTVIRIQGLGKDSLRLEIYDLCGRLVKSFPLTSAIIWDGTNANGEKLAPGIYFVELHSMKFKITQKVVLLNSNHL